MGPASSDMAQRNDNDNISPDYRSGGDENDDESKGKGIALRNRTVLPLAQPNFLSPDPPREPDPVHTPVGALQQGADTPILMNLNPSTARCGVEGKYNDYESSVLQVQDATDSASILKACAP